jgi:predicted RNA-binding protein YlxR (DUF448 family)
VARARQLPRQRHVPQRTCVACRQGKAKRDLVRVVRTTSGGVRVDPTGKQSGRGAYLCSNPACWTSALNKGVLPRALKIDAVPEDDLHTLTEYAGRLAP